jgi:Ser/Thr protein kinase RdoA (MazF antagonist)
MGTTARSHGLNGTLVEPDWPPLTLDEVRALLAEFPGCGEPIRILSVSPRPFSAASVVATASRRVFIKRQSLVVRDREGLAEEHRFMTHLRAHGAPVPKVFASTSGQTAIENGCWIYEVHEVPEGVDLYADALSWTPFFSVRHAYSAGRMLARLHLAAQGFNEPQRKIQPLVASFTIFAAEDPGTALERYLAARPALAEDATTRKGCREALELLVPFYAELKPLLPALEPLWTHNDLHASNLLWSDASDHARATAVIDFGLADRTNTIYDLAQTIERNIVEWLALHEGFENTEDVPIHLDHLKALLDGYESVRPLSEEEAAALAPMMALGHVEFALTEADYFLRALHSKENARVCSEGYLAGHARWFRGPCGQRLLNEIGHWVATRKQKEAMFMGVEA